MSSFEKDGYWFLPENPDRKIFGRLSFFSEEPPKLFLADQLRDSEDIQRMMQGDDYEIINGHFLDGKEVTLVDCYQKGGFKTGFQTSNIFAHYIVVGHHFKSKSDINLLGISARYTYLEEWISSSVFDAWKTQLEESNYEINIKQSIVSPVQLGQLSGFTVFLQDLPCISIEHLNLLNILGGTPNEFILKEKKSVVLKSDEEKNLDNFIDVLILFQDFLLFCTGELIDIFEISSFILIKKKKPRIPHPIELKMMLDSVNPNGIAINLSSFMPNQDKSIEEEVSVFLQIYFSTGIAQSEKKSLNRRKTLLMFHEIKDKMPNVLQAWELNKQDYGSIFDLYLRLTYIPERHVDDLFLTISQAIEAFHRVCHEQDRFDENIFSIVRETMINSISMEPGDYGLSKNHESVKFIAEFKETVENKLKYINEFSLKERLIELCNEYRECLPKQIFRSKEMTSLSFWWKWYLKICSDQCLKTESFDLWFVSLVYYLMLKEAEEIESFSKQVRDTRGSLTHISKSSNRKKSKHVIPREERRELTRKLYTLLQACLIRQLGLDDIEVKNILAKR